MAAQTRAATAGMVRRGQFRGVWKAEPTGFVGRKLEHERGRGVRNDAKMFDLSS